VTRARVIGAPRTTTLTAMYDDRDRLTAKQAVMGAAVVIGGIAVTTAGLAMAVYLAWRNRKDRR
jgi:hypothetical protein